MKREVAGLMCLLAIADASAQCQSLTTDASGKTIHTRCKIDALSAVQLASLQRAVDVMRRRNSAPPETPAFATSWVHWANTHQHFGKTHSGYWPMSDLLTELTDSSQPPADWPFQDWNPSVQQMRVWAWCPHRDSPDFLAWHRVYLYYLEKAMRAAAGDPALTLPYWDYAADGASASNASAHIQVPAPFISGGPLYQKWQDATFVIAFDADVRGAFSSGTTSEFWAAIEEAPHNRIHGDLGGFMINPLSAAYTQIFFAHHAEIDRLWSCWEQRAREQGLNPTSIASSQLYSFYDETGAEHRKTLNSFLADIEGDPTSVIRYDARGYCPKLTLLPTRIAAAPPTAAGGQHVFTLRGNREVVLEAEPEGGRAVSLPTAPGSSTSTTLTFGSFGQSQIRNALGRQISFPPAGPGSIPAGRILLRLSTSVTGHLPDRNVRVFLSPADSSKEELVGVISPFALDPSIQHAANNAAHAPTQFEFDVTDVIRNLGGVAYKVTWRVPTEVDNPNSPPVGSLEVSGISLVVESQTAQPVE